MAIRKDFGFIGRLSLDFAQTGDMGWGDRYERLTSPGEFRRWLSLSPLAVSRARVSANDVAEAKRLRRAIWEMAVALVEHEPAKTSHVRMLNRTARFPALVRTLDPRGTSSHWHHPTARAALATIAQDAIALFGDPATRARVRRCENAKCRVVFYDGSRPGGRRWCAPNRCGDRMRARDYRERNRA